MSKRSKAYQAGQVASDEVFAS
jgi:hypothetical protein